MFHPAGSFLLYGKFVWFLIWSFLYAASLFGYNKGDILNVLREMDMSITSIIELGKEYLILGGLLAALVVAAFLAGYFIVYKRLMKGSRRLQPAKVFIGFAFLVYLVVVAGAVFGSRGNYYEQGNLNLQPLSSYKEAWYTFSFYAWRNLILNILLFLPMGILLPLLLEKCRKFWVTYLAGFGVSVMIELVQYMAHRGIVEFDDVLNNTVGTMIGYGLAAVILSLWKRRREQSGLYPKGVLVCLQLPLVFTVLAFVLVFGIYAGKELWNL